MITTTQPADLDEGQAKSDRLRAEVRQANIDYLARELFICCRLCLHCQNTITLADQLAGQCPHCQAIMLAGPITPERAREMLLTLKARRVELGLLEA